jgi:glyceraldehyde 3-phosphate dehydrogenase
MVRAAINGYGRIGRVAHRVILQWHTEDIEVVAINVGSSTDLKGWMYLLKYDSVYGLLPFEVSVKPNQDAATNKSFLGHLVVNGKEIPVYSQKDPALLPWKDLNIDVVIECTGAFTSKEKIQQHIAAGAKSAVLSAPAKDGEPIPTYVVSVNDTQYQGENVISNASCTTNCITPPAKVISEQFGIDKAMMTTIHGYTSDQELHDGGHKDYRRARAAALNIVPTSTGATIAAAEALPQLKGIFAGLSLRVPVPVGSLSDITFLLKRDVTVQEVNDALKKESENPIFKGILAVTEDPLVSSDIIGNSHSSIVDLSLTQVVGGNMLKIVAWYDNEYGYANRLVEQTIMVGQKVSGTDSTPSPETPPAAPQGDQSVPQAQPVQPAPMDAPQQVPPQPTQDPNQMPPQGGEQSVPQTPQDPNQPQNPTN